ncbi:uncharacterized protein EI90DRAFT_3118027 [Cantharellus anzutake]|uniref:uncharacterized protein n=1 Tax=Cantharellus anzutake TaxID=1750568 RepID=UPI001903A01C|nr:uncharacterized protein EI90DRAFT_3118027 [Cantharellus anzutake]KAF8338966.1 hypothetical protein EI90DRAFT_3118027 [Cantharellus anzutake]
MLVLFETPLGFCLFKFNEGKFSSTDIWKEFETPERANAAIKLKAIHRFGSTADAVEDITAMQEGKLSKALQDFLTDEVVKRGKKDKLAVIDKTLASSIHKKLGIDVVSDSTSLDLFRGIRGQLATLLDGLNPQDMATMNLGLSHSLSRFKLKFSPDKIDTMVIQAVALIDDLDKEINVYSMRIKEWYGWHFPEMGKIVVDNLAYAKVVKTLGIRTNAAITSLADILPEDLEAAVKASSEISMGSEISEGDMEHIRHLCDQVISITEYRSQLGEYLQNRMHAIAPNLTALVGEFIGARLISHAGSLNNLAKQPASTVQIFGAEKALFRALKAKHNTPKYGLLYHASLVSQTPPKLKGKMSRMLATKTSLSARVDAIADVNTKSDDQAPSIGVAYRAKLESRIRALSYRSDLNPAPGQRGRVSRNHPKFEMSGGPATAKYNTAADSAAEEVKADRLKRKEENRAAKEAKKGKKARKEDSNDDQGERMEVDGADNNEDEDEEKEKERKRLRKLEKRAAKEAARALKAQTEDGDGEAKKKKKSD